MLLLACVASLGGWLVVAPALPAAGATVVEPPANLDPPHAASGHDMASAAPRRASDAAMLAAVPASGVAASGIAKSGSRCGDDQAPVYADPVPDEDGVIRAWPAQTRPAGVGYTGAQRRVDAALRATGDPFDAAVADALNVGDLRTPDARLAAVVQDAVTGDDPRVYQLAFTACQGAQMQQVAVFAGGPPVAGEAGLRSCTRLDPRRWAARDPGNAVPWFFALERADAAGDLAGQREAWQQLAASSRFRMGYGAATASVASLQLPDDADFAGQAVLAMQALPFELWPSFSGVTQRCKDKAGGDAAMAAACERIAGVLFDHADGLLPRAVGGSIHKLATGDATRLEQAHKEAKDIGQQWATLNADTPGAEASPCDASRKLMRHFVLVGKVGEAEAMRQEIAARTAK